MEKVIEECSDHTSPVNREECGDDEVDDENSCNLIEENEKKFNDENEDSTDVEEKEENATIDPESNTVAKNNHNINGICEGEEINYDRSGNYVASLEES